MQDFELKPEKKVFFFKKVKSDLIVPSNFEYLYCSKFNLSTQLINPIFSVTDSVACLQAFCGFFIAEKPGKFAIAGAIAGAILDGRENRPGEIDKARGRGLGEREKTSLASLPPPLRFVTRPRPIFALAQDGAGDRKLRVFRGFSAIKTPTNRLQAGYRLSTSIFNLSR